jgi:two-component system response regulator BaeR
MLSARATEDDQVRGLELGADDYITKPFSPRQVVARIRSVLRRFGGGDVVRLGPLELDCRSLRVAIDGQSVAVTHTEARVLRALMEAKGRALSRDEILDRAFDGRPDCADRTVDAHVKNLRRKLADRSASIVTIFGVGYRMDMTAEWPG